MQSSLSCLRFCPRNLSSDYIGRYRTSELNFRATTLDLQSYNYQTTHTQRYQKGLSLPSARYSARLVIHPTIPKYTLAVTNGPLCYISRYQFGLSMTNHDISQKLVGTQVLCPDSCRSPSQFMNRK